jgi:hypothetical protein
MSKTATFFSGANFCSSKAEKMPPGPAPMMITSYCINVLLAQAIRCIYYNGKNPKCQHMENLIFSYFFLAIQGKIWYK